MVIDTFDNINLYKALSDDIYAGLLFLKRMNVNIEFGVHTINSRVRAIVEQYDTVCDKGLEFESHQHVVDIQYPVIGTERVFWSPIREMDVKTPYDKEKDRTIFVNPHTQSTYADIGNGVFAIMFESDGHSPQHCAVSSQTIKKVTIKVLTG